MKESEHELEARERAIESMVSQLVAGCSQEEFLKFRCPVCGSGLSLCVWNRRVFLVRCKRNPKHMAVYKGVDVGADWWAGFAAEGNMDESEQEFEARKRAIEGMVSRLVAGCSQEEFLKFTCPVCGAGLSLNVHPNRRVFLVRCKQNSTHMGVTEGADRSVDWWANFVSGPWYSDAPKSP